MSDAWIVSQAYRRAPDPSNRSVVRLYLIPDGGGAHSDHEWIDKVGLEQFYEVIKAYVTEVAKVR